MQLPTRRPRIRIMYWGEPRDPDEVIRVLRRAVALGVTFIDRSDGEKHRILEFLDY